MTIPEQIDGLQKSVDGIAASFSTFPAAMQTMAKKMQEILDAVNNLKIPPPPSPDIQELSIKIDAISAQVAPKENQIEKTKGVNSND